MAFGDADDRSLYITACTHLLKIRMKIPGAVRQLIMDEPKLI
jgi:hypothetical protein